MLPDENFDEMFENQEPLRLGDVPGDVPVFSLPELLLAKPGRAGICLGAVGVVVGEGTEGSLPLLVGLLVTTGAGAGLDGASRDCCDKERCRVAAAFVPLSVFRAMPHQLLLLFQI